MTQQHPITPPPDLLKEWIDAWYGAKVKHENMTEFVATQAARWGADQELEACVEWASCFNYDDYRYDEVLRDIRRRPKPLSLKEQAMALIDGCNDPHGDHLDDVALDTIRRALEALPDD